MTEENENFIAQLLISERTNEIKQIFLIIKFNVEAQWL